MSYGFYSKRVIAAIVRSFSWRHEWPLFPKRPGAAIGLACLALAAGFAAADDVKVQPPSGAGFVVTDQTGASERLRVNEAGGVYLPGLATSTATQNGVCRDATTGQLGTCPFVPPPSAACKNGEVITYDGSAWVCTIIAPLRTVQVMGPVVRISCFHTDKFTPAAPCPFSTMDSNPDASCVERNEWGTAILGPCSSLEQHGTALAVCPAGWWAVSTTCRPPFGMADARYPLSGGINMPSNNATNIYDQRVGQCVYTGSVKVLYREDLQATTLCMEAP